MTTSSTIDAILVLVEARRIWRNNGSTLQFSKTEGALFQQFKRLFPETCQYDMGTDDHNRNSNQQEERYPLLALEHG